MNLDECLDIVKKRYYQTSEEYKCMDYLKDLIENDSCDSTVYAYRKELFYMVINLITQNKLLEKNWLNALKDSRELEDVRKQLYIKDVWCNGIKVIGFDYDGCETVEGLQNLVDELVLYAGKAMDCNNTHPSYIDFEEILGGKQ